MANVTTMARAIITLTVEPTFIPLKVYVFGISIQKYLIMIYECAKRSVNVRLFALLELVSPIISDHI